MVWSSNNDDESPWGKVKRINHQASMVQVKFHLMTTI